MENPFAPVIENGLRALDSPDPQESMEDVLLEAVKDPDIASAIAARTKFSNLADLAIYRSDELTLLAGALPPGFTANPHNHNLWSVVAVSSGQEDNRFYEPLGRFPTIEEDASPVHLLCGEYPVGD